MRFSGRSEHIELDASRTAVVTGACGGIGRALVDDLAAKGLSVAAVDVVSSPPNAWSHERRVEYFRSDCGSVSATRGLADEVHHRLGPASIVICCAASGLSGPVQHCEQEDVVQVIHDNLVASIRVAMAFLPQMMALPVSARIVLFSSPLAKFATRRQCGYAGSKAAVEQFTRVARRDLRGTNVGLTLVVPGAVSTRFTASTVERGPRARRGLALQLHSAFARSPEVVSDSTLAALQRGRAIAVVGWEARLLRLLGTLQRT